MNIKDFNAPTAHPFDLLPGYKNAYEKESVLQYILSRCIEAGEFIAVETIHDHHTMVTDGLLEEIGDREYKLTTKAIGLLYSQYGRQS